MSMDSVKWALNLPHKNATQKLVLIVLAYHTKNGLCAISVSYIQKTTGLSRVAIIAATSAMEGLGIIKINRKPGVLSSYTLNETFKGRDWTIQNPPKIPREIRTAVLSRDGVQCKNCGSVEHLAIDHIVPRSASGPTTIDNLQVLCRSCNSRKGARV